MKLYRAIRSTSLLILKLGSTWMWLIIMTPGGLNSRERTPVPIEEEVG